MRQTCVNNLKSWILVLSFEKLGYPHLPLAHLRNAGTQPEVIRGTFWHWIGKAAGGEERVEKIQFSR